MQVALAWLLQRSPNILLIPGTSSLAHLRENLEASRLQIPSEVIADLDAIGTRRIFRPSCSVRPTLTNPRCQDIPASAIPDVTEDDGTRVRIICGEFWGK